MRGDEGSLVLVFNFQPYLIVPRVGVEERDERAFLCGAREFHTRAVLDGSAGWLWCSRVSLLASNDNSGAFCCTTGFMSMLVLSLM
jgi:hypothetical protein